MRVRASIGAFACGRSYSRGIRPARLGSSDIDVIVPQLHRSLLRKRVVVETRPRLPLSLSRASRRRAKKWIPTSSLLANLAPITLRSFLQYLYIDYHHVCQRNLRRIIVFSC